MAYLALATDAVASTSPTYPPSLVGAYASEAEALAYVAWENARADGTVYYVQPVAELVA